MTLKPSYQFITFLTLITLIKGAVKPPLWADPEINPCATEPRGWQYIFWPLDQQCYKIFQVGYPCPPTMELVPSINSRIPRELKAECRCPPLSALSIADSRCYELFQNGPCEKGQYFAPSDSNITEFEQKLRIGACKHLESCPKSNEIFWPLDGKCYRKYTQGPCPKGQLLDLNSRKVPACTCSNENELKKYFWKPTSGCYEHFTRGPCQEKGHLFLPNRVCDCHYSLPHYHEDSQQCYELESTGPCKRGHHFILDEAKELNSTIQRAQCKCKNDHIFWQRDGKCYRPYTQGPCKLGQILVNSTSCITMPCGKGYLYFPEQKTCYRIGTQGPCLTGQIVTFDFRTRPSVDGISYNGICACSGPLNSNSNCLKEKRSTKTCEAGLILYKNKCYKLYTQGPCNEGQWLVPNRQQKNQQIWYENAVKNSGRCECKPGYTTSISLDNKNTVRCLPPTVSLANYLNKFFAKDV